MMFGAVAGLLAQWGIIRMFEMTPRQLLRWGVACAAVGNLSWWPWRPTTPPCHGGYAIASLGYGFARPGFTAGRPSLWSCRSRPARPAPSRR
jgi:hypothetical protein